MHRFNAAREVELEKAMKEKNLDSSAAAKSIKDKVWWRANIYDAAVRADATMHLAVEAVRLNGNEGRLIELDGHLDEVGRIE